MLAAALAALLALPALADPAAPEPPFAEAELSLEAARLRRFAAEARWSEGLGVFFPYESVAAGLTTADRAWAVALWPAMCRQAQAWSARGAYHLERHRVRHELSRSAERLERESRLDAIALRGAREAGLSGVPDVEELRASRLERHRLWERGRRLRLAALARVTEEDGLGPLDSLTAVSGADYRLTRAPCPPPPAR